MAAAHASCTPQRFPAEDDPEMLDERGLLRGRRGGADGRAEYALEGELDLASAHALFRRIALLAAERPGDVYLDLEGLTFLGSTGIQAILSAHAGLRQQERRLVLRNLHGAPRRALQLTGTLAVLEVEGP